MGLFRSSVEFAVRVVGEHEPKASAFSEPKTSTATSTHVVKRPTKP